MAKPEKKPLPLRELAFTMEENEYKVKFPNNDQLFRIESKKLSLTSGQYYGIANGNTLSAQRAQYTVDMIAFLSTCCPEMLKDLKVDAFSDLEAIQTKNMLKVYIGQIMPWLLAWELALNAPDAEEDEEETEEQEEAEDKK